MGNICCCIGDSGRRRRSNVSPATETTPPQPEIPPNRSIFAAATYDPSLCRNSNLYPQFPDYCPSRPGTLPASYDRQPHPWIAGGRDPMLPPPYVEYEKAVTIRNDTNLRKETLRLEPDPENPGRLLVAFTFDAIVSGRITVIFFAKEGAEFQLTATKEDTLPPITFDFQKGGLGQKFVQASGTGVDLSVFEDSELFKEASTDIVPLAIKLEAAPSAVNPEDGKSGSANMQITQVTYVKENGQIKPSAMKQLLWVNGNRYELQEIYGIGNTVDGCNEDANVSEKECVICLSEPRDTTVLPCRHMCMCSGCAKVLRFQTNLCPVCRQPVERLLEIKVNGNSSGRNGDGD